MVLISIDEVVCRYESADLNGKAGNTIINRFHYPLNRLAARITGERFQSLLPSLVVEL